MSNSSEFLEKPPPNSDQDGDIFQDRVPLKKRLFLKRKAMLSEEGSEGDRPSGKKLISIGHRKVKIPKEEKPILDESDTPLDHEEDLDHDKNQGDNISESSKKSYKKDRKKSLVMSLNKHEKFIKRLKVVKNKFKPFLVNPELYEGIFKVVHTANQMSYIAHTYLNFHILRILTLGLPIPDLSSQAFYCHLYSAVIPIGETTRPNQEFTDSLKEFLECFPTDFEYPDKANMSQLQNTMSAQLVTQVTNHLEVNIDTRFGRYLKAVYEIEDGRERQYITNRAMYGPSGYTSKFDTYKNQKELDAYNKRQSIIEKYSKVFKELSSISNNKKYYGELLKFHYMIHKEVENKEGKKWSLLPEKGSFITSHLEISTSTLPDVLSLCLTEKSKAYFGAKGKEVWSEYFKIPKRRGTFKFEGTITTNGYDVSVHYRKITRDFSRYLKRKEIPVYDDLTTEEKIKTIIAYKEEKNEEFTKEADKKKETEKDKKKKKEKSDKDRSFLKEVQKLIEEGRLRIFGNDPGDRCLFTMSDVDDKVIRCTRKEYKHLTGQGKRTKKINTRKDSLRFVQELSKYSLHTSDLEKYKKNLKEILKYVHKMFSEYKREYYRKLQFTGYIKKQLTYNALCNKIEGKEKGKEKIEGDEEKKILIGWGNGGGNRKGLKGTKLPCKGFKNEVERKCRRVLLKDVDEYLTTQMCSKCGCKTGDVKVKKTIKGVERLVSVYGLRRCTNNECRITWDRDVNASRNILKILMCELEGKERPEYLQRKTVPGTS